MTPALPPRYPWNHNGVPMNPEVEAIYKEFEELGPLEVRGRLASHVIAREDKVRHAQNWLEMKDHEERSARDAEAMALAREANSVARAANDLASSANTIAEAAAASALESANAARTNNIIATIALIAAVIAIAISIIGMFVR